MNPGVWLFFTGTTLQAVSPGVFSLLLLTVASVLWFQQNTAHQLRLPQTDLDSSCSSQTASESDTEFLDMD